MIISKLSIALLMSLFLNTTIFTQSSNNSNTFENQIIVQLKPSQNIQPFLENKTSTIPGAAIKSTKLLSQKRNIHLLDLDFSPIGKKPFLQALKNSPEVLHAQWNQQVEFRLEPNDPQYGEQWSLERIKVPDAWEINTGGLTVNGDTIVIAILDSGFDITHQDLLENIWFNHAEIPGDNIDNDNNGYVDDYAGWNFIADTNEHGLATHGHAVAGIAGAKGNNAIGVTGVNWNIKMMVLDVKTISSIIAAYEYLLDQRLKYNESNGASGAFVVATNASWGIEDQFCSEQPIIRDLYDEMGAVGILTAAGTANTHYNVDQFGDFPTTCPSEYLLTVTNTEMNDEKANNSGFGVNSIDMGVPGDDSHTTRLNNNYGSFGSNSAAAPHLTGAIGLLYSILCQEMAEQALTSPASIAKQVRDALLEGVDPVFDLSEYTKTGGRLNVVNSAEILLNSCNILTGPLEIIQLSPNPASSNLKIVYQSPDFEEYTLLLHDALGRLIYTASAKPDKFQEKAFEIDVSGLSAGLYTVSIRNTNRMTSEKVIVIH